MGGKGTRCDDSVNGRSVPQAMVELFDVKDSVEVNYFETELPVAVYSPSDLQPPDPIGPIEVPPFRHQ